MKRFFALALFGILCGLGAAGYQERAQLVPRVQQWAGAMRDTAQGSLVRDFSGLRRRPSALERPWGMAPEPFRAYIRACNAAQIHPFRIGQTIGDHPRSVGYHKQDGVIEEDGKQFEYCAAVDIGADDLTPARRAFFLEALAKQGFAAWWRSGENWQGDEHIHAIYALIPMKPQLREQVLLWLRERREDDKPRPKWLKKLRRSKQFKEEFS